MEKYEDYDWLIEWVKTQEVEIILRGNYEPENN